MPRIATAPALVIGLLSASLFGLFYMAALNNPSIVKPPRPVARGTRAEAGRGAGTRSGASTSVSRPLPPDPPTPTSPAI